jgi:hypothetical protein
MCSNPGELGFKKDENSDIVAEMPAGFEHGIILIIYPFQIQIHIARTPARTH